MHTQSYACMHTYNCTCNIFCRLEGLAVPHAVHHADEGGGGGDDDDDDVDDEYDAVNNHCYCHHYTTAIQQNTILLCLHKDYQLRKQMINRFRYTVLCDVCAYNIQACMHNTYIHTYACMCTTMQMYMAVTQE